MENKDKPGKYIPIPVGKLPEKVSAHDIRNNRSKLVKMLVDYALYANPAKREFYSLLGKQEQERALYGDDIYWGVD